MASRAAWVVCLIGLAASCTANPCKTAKALGSLEQRVVGYTLAPDETPLCDYYMHQGWYSMNNYVIASTNENCGTVYNWYRLDDLPNDGEITEIQVFENSGNKFSDTKFINVSRCEGNKYVFELVPPDGCPSAYCIETQKLPEKNDTPPDISSIGPEINAAVGKSTDGNNVLQFYCDFDPPQNTEYFYIIEYGQSSGLAWIATVESFSPEKYVDKEDFRNKTALTQQMLTDKTLGLGVRLACSVTARITANSTSSPAKLSASKFFGIEVVNKTIVIENDKEETVFLKLTVPFGCGAKQTTCYIDLNVYIPLKEGARCRLAEASRAGGKRNRCGVQIRNDQVGELIPLVLAAKAGNNRLHTGVNYNVVLRTHKSFPSHPFFSNYVLETIRVQVWTNMALLEGKQCYSHNDPHMGSFDGMAFENQKEGTFLLYRNTEYKTQVQMQTTYCYGSETEIFCNCGVAVSAGRDVIIISNCGNENQATWWINFRTCKDGVLQDKLKKKSDTQFEVHLPTGTRVNVQLWGPLLNVDIYPGLSDYHHTEGLCGPFDGSKTNDRQIRPNSTQEDPNDSWRVLPNEDLFSPKNDLHLEPWKEEKILCTCDEEPADTKLLGNVTCKADKALECSEDARTASVGHCSVSRKKRNAHGLYVDRLFDYHLTSTTNFISRIQWKQVHASFRPVHRRESYDNTTAKAGCLEVFNTSIYQKCTSETQISTSGFLEDCILDALLTNSMDWALNHLEAIKGKCIHEVTVNQPLPEAILGDIQIEVNGTIVDFNSTNKTEILDIPTFTQEILDEFQDLSCPKECSEHGTCKEGNCVCSLPYGGTDCSVDITRPPIMQGIPDKGECDLQLRECEKTSVYAYNVAETDKLSCRLIPIKYGVTKEVTFENRFIAQAELLSFVEVSCPLNNRRKRRSVDNGTDYLARGYRVSISNDGKLYSEEDVIIIFDSECVTCTKSNSEIVCSRKTGYCIRYGQCYTSGETYGCEQCEGDSDDTLTWTPGPDCPVSIAPTEVKKLWIIAAVVVPFALLLFAAIVYIFYNRKRKTKGLVLHEEMCDIKDDNN